MKTVMLNNQKLILVVFIFIFFGVLIYFTNKYQTETEILISSLISKIEKQNETEVELIKNLDKLKEELKSNTAKLQDQHTLVYKITELEKKIILLNSQLQKEKEENNSTNDGQMKTKYEKIIQDLKNDCNNKTESKKNDGIFSKLF